MTKDEIFDVLSAEFIGFNMRHFLINHRTVNEINENQDRFNRALDLYAEYIRESMTMTRLLHIITVMSGFEEQLRKNGRTLRFPGDIVAAHLAIIRDCRRLSEDDEEESNILQFPSLIIKKPL